MKSRQILIAIMILATMWHASAAQANKKDIQVEAPPLEKVLIGTGTELNAVLSDLTEIKPEMPLGPQDVLKSYEIAMSLVAEKTSSDFSVIVQAQQANQISREQAEYLLQQTYQVAMMQYQVLSSLHEVLRHEIDEAAQREKDSLKTASTDELLIVPVPSAASVQWQ